MKRNSFDIVSQAREIAIEAHGNQRRKYNGTPYWLHPARVAGLVSAYTYDARVVASAWLHDTLEDTRLTQKDLSHLGGFVEGVVSILTKPKKENGVNRSMRNEIYYGSLKLAQVCYGKIIAPSTLIKLADRYDNLRELPNNDFFYTYCEETKELLKYLDVQHELVILIRDVIGDD